MAKSTAARVTGIGGIFIKAHHRKHLLAWYARHLGLPVENEWGGCVFDHRISGRPARAAYTTWSAFPADTDYFGPSRKPFMVNFRVADLDGLLATLEKEDVWIDPRRDESEFGRFAWIMDCEGNRIELWEPPRVRRTGKKKSGAKKAVKKRPAKRTPR